METKLTPNQILDQLFPYTCGKRATVRYAGDALGVSYQSIQHWRTGADVGINTISEMLLSDITLARQFARLAAPGRIEHLTQRIERALLEQRLHDHDAPATYDPTPEQSEAPASSEDTPV